MRAKLLDSGNILQELAPGDPGYVTLAGYLWARGGGRVDLSAFTIKYGLHTDDPDKVAKIVEGFGSVGKHLAEFYRDLWNASPKTVTHDRIEHVDAELADGDWLLWFDNRVGKWAVNHAEDDGGGVELSAAHSPKGGVSIAGKFYRGGQFIPASEVAKAAPEVKAKIEAAKTAREDKRRGRGNIDTQSLRSKLAAHGHHELSSDDIRSQKASFRALASHHGELVVHRLEEIAGELQDALDRLPADEEGQRKQLGKRLKAVDGMIDMANAAGHTGQLAAKETPATAAKVEAAVDAVANFPVTPTTPTPASADHERLKSAVDRFTKQHADAKAELESAFPNGRPTGGLSTRSYDERAQIVADAEKNLKHFQGKLDEATAAEKPDAATSDFFGVKPEQRSMWQEGVVKEGWVGALPEKAAEPLYVPNAGEHESSAEKGTPAANSVPSPSPDTSPREIANAQTTAEKSDYEFARKSAISNIGEDLKGSARHKRNAWRGLAEAEADGTAEELVTRQHLLKNEPHNLMAALTPTNALNGLVGHLAMQKFPAKPNIDRQTKEKAQATRAQFLEAYRNIKAACEKIALEAKDPGVAISSIQHEIGNEITRLRKDDRYNSVANSLVPMYRATHSNWRASASGVASQVNDFRQRLQKAYGNIGEDNPASGVYKSQVEHVKDIMEGESFNKTFGTVESGKKGFDSASLYVKHATRKGGRMIDAATVKTGEKFVTDNLKMRGLQWGNSVTDEERVHHLTKSSEALADLADILQLPDHAMSLDGSLGLAIGARGTGNALAHYEPGTKVINLTRKNGVGSLAHEWGHALDHWLDGGSSYLSDKVTYWKKDYDEAVKNEMAAVHKAMRDSGFQERLTNALRDSTRSKDISQKKASEYWNSNIEKFARVFEVYVQHKLETADRENTYLSGVTPHAFWPNKEEIAKIAPAVDAFIATVKEKHFKQKPASLSAATSTPAPFIPPLSRITVSLSTSATDTGGGGRWITIGGKHGESGERHGGSPVFVKDGRIVKGAPSLTGKKIDALNEDAEPISHRKELNQSKGHARAVWGKRARSEGIDSASLHQLAGEMLAHDKEFKAEITTMLKDARQTAASDVYGNTQLGGKGVRNAIAAGTFDYSTIPHFDEIAASMAVQHPNAFQGFEGREEERLADLIEANDPQAMGEDEAYETALDHLLSMKHEKEHDRARKLAEPVPFSMASRMTIG